MKAIIIDDEPLARSIIKEYLQPYTNISLVEECNDGFEGIKAIQHHQPDLIFLDIQMPKINGFEMLELVDHPPLVIFTTAFEEYAITAFEVEAIDYLQKPFGLERFRQTAERVKKRIAAVEKNEPIHRIFVRDKRGLIPLATNEIVWLKADDDYTIIYTKDKTFLVGTNLRDFAAKLNPDKFLRWLIATLHRRKGRCI